MTHTLPNDPIILLSFVNTELRDHYHHLEDFCLAYNIELNSITEKLKAVDYLYDPDTNQFI